MSANPTPRPHKCPACDQDHLRCLAHRKSDGQPCREHPIDGLDVCYHHGGATKNARAAATERVARAEIVQVARTLGLARDGVSEAQAMREELSRTLAHIEWLEVVVTDLGAEEVFWARTMEETGRESGSVTGQSEGGTTRDHAKVRREARLNVAVQYLMTERKHLVVVAGKMIELGLQEREVHLAEQQGRLWASIMRAVLGDQALGLSPAQIEKAPEIVSKHLRLLGET
jgi:hypothetical protein